MKINIYKLSATITKEMVRDLVCTIELPMQAGSWERTMIWIKNLLRN